MLDVYGGEYEFISIHAPAGGATGWGEEILPINEISIHAPAGGATSFSELKESLSIFQFTPLREGRPGASWPALWQSVFQFTPLREGRLLPPEKFSADNSISIHAPAGGATNDIMHDVRMMVFQFTPLREGRPARNQELIHGKLFQFTPLREGRRAGRDHHRRQRCISIHAPAGGATTDR